MAPSTESKQSSSAKSGGVDGLKNEPVGDEVALSHSIEYTPFTGVHVKVVEDPHAISSFSGDAITGSDRDFGRTVCVLLVDRGTIFLKRDNVGLQLEQGQAVAFSYDLGGGETLSLRSGSGTRLIEIAISKGGVSNACIALGIPIPRAIEKIREPGDQEKFVSLQRTNFFSLFIRSLNLNEVPENIHLEVMRLKIGELFSYFSALESDDTAHDPQLKRVKEYLEENVATTDTVRELASMVGLNRTALSLGFKEEYGVSIREFRRNLKLKHAHRLLIDTNMSINEISIACGYGSAGNFSRAFKQQFGFSPSDVRLK